MGKKGHTTTVLIAIPNRSDMCLEQVAFSRMQLVNKTKELMPDVAIRFARNSIYYIDEARWELARVAVDKNVDYLFFLDSDIEVPEQALAVMLQMDVDFATAIAFTNDLDKPVPSIFLYVPEEARMEKDKAWAPVLMYWQAPPEVKALEIDGCGLYACLIKTEVFNRIAEAHNSLIEWYNPFKRNGAGEDLSFCDRVRELGIKVIARRDLQCDHVPHEVRPINESYYLERFNPKAYDVVWVGETKKTEEMK